MKNVIKNTTKLAGARKNFKNNIKKLKNNKTTKQQKQNV